MNKLFTLLSVSFLAAGAYGQSVAVFSGNTKVMASNTQAIDSIVFYADNQTITPPRNS